RDRDAIVWIDVQAHRTKANAQALNERPIELRYCQHRDVATRLQRERDAEVRIHVAEGAPAGYEDASHRFRDSESGIGNSGSGHHDQGSALGIWVLGSGFWDLKTYPSHFRTGNRGYLGNRGSVNDSRQR